MKQKLNKLILLFIISLVMILGFSTIVNAADETFKLDDETIDIILNGSKILFYENKPTDENITWSSADSSIASVNSKGEVTANAIGTTTITATVGTQTDSCTVNVIYNDYLSKKPSVEVRLVIGEYESKTVSVIAKDYNLKEVTNPKVEWKSENENIAKVDNTGKITAVNVGTTKVTAKVPGAETSFDVIVTKVPEFTDFSNAKFELNKSAWATVNLKITNITNSEKHNSYYYCITPNNEKPRIELKSSGYLKTENSNWKIMNDAGWANLSEYVELNQDLYLWVVEVLNLDDEYYDDDNGYSVCYKTGLEVSGKKLERPKYPVYAEMFFATYLSHDSSQLAFNIPTGHETIRKFTLKIGKITDTNILNDIKNNKGEAWNSLLEYSKNSNAIYNNKLSTTEKGYPSYNTSKGAEKINLELEDKEYYYMYVVFDDENGKYYPASGLTIAKADVFKDSGAWYMFFLGDKDFKWDDFGIAKEGTDKVDNTIIDGPKQLPYTGIKTAGIVLLVMIGSAIFFNVKNNKYKGI